MSGLFSWMIFVQIGILIMGTGSLASWIIFSSRREAFNKVENSTQQNR